MFSGLPADGRRILGRECLRMFEDILPRLWEATLLASSHDLERARKHIETLEDYEALQEALTKNNWAAFVANGSLLPRASGISDLPLEKDGVAMMSIGNLVEDAPATVWRVK